MNTASVDPQARVYLQRAAAGQSLGAQLLLAGVQDIASDHAAQVACRVLIEDFADNSDAIHPLEATVLMAALLGAPDQGCIPQAAMDMALAVADIDVGAIGAVALLANPLLALGSLAGLALLVRNQRSAQALGGIDTPLADILGEVASVDAPAADLLANIVAYNQRQAQAQYRDNLLAAFGRGAWRGASAPLLAAAHALGVVIGAAAQAAVSDVWPLLLAGVLALAGYAWYRWDRRAT